MYFILKAFLYLDIKIIQLPPFEKWGFCLGFFGKKVHKNFSTDYFRVHDYYLFIFITADIIGNQSLIYYRISNITEPTEKNEVIKLFCLKIITNIWGLYYSYGINCKIYYYFNSLRNFNSLTIIKVSSVLKCYWKQNLKYLTFQWHRNSGIFWKSSGIAFFP